MCRMWYSHSCFCHVPFCQKRLVFVDYYLGVCQVEVRGQDGKLLSAYSFTHLTLQEFLAALRIMTSNDVSDAELKKR